MAQRHSEKARIIVVGEKRTEAVLLPLIEQYIPKTCRIYSDGWRSYINLNNHGLLHGDVDHSKHFVNPLSKDLLTEPIHTNTIESCWSCAKAHIRVCRGTAIKSRQAYMD